MALRRDLSNPLLYRRQDFIFSCTLLDLSYGDSTESLPIIYLFPRHMTVLEKKGINHIIPSMMSFIGDRRYHKGESCNLRCSRVMFRSALSPRTNKPTYISPATLRELTAIAKDTVSVEGSQNSMGRQAMNTLFVSNSVKYLKPPILHRSFPHRVYLLRQCLIPPCSLTF